MDGESLLAKESVKLNNEAEAIQSHYLSLTRFKFLMHFLSILGKYKLKLFEKRVIFAGDVHSLVLRNLKLAKDSNCESYYLNTVRRSTHTCDLVVSLDALGDRIKRWC